MKIEVNQATLAATKKCKKDFLCISQSGKGICTVRACVADKAALIECAEKTPCEYKVEYDSTLICTCPTRIEIYKRYQI